MQHTSFPAQIYFVEIKYHSLSVLTPNLKAKQLQFTVNQIPLMCISHVPKILLDMAWGDSLISLT